MNMAGAPKDSPGLENVLSAEDLVEKDLKTWIDEEIDREVQHSFVDFTLSHPLMFT